MLKRILNNSEGKIYDRILNSIADSDLRLLCQIKIADVIGRNDIDLSNSERNTFKETSFDFIVTNKDNWPLFAVDFDGPCH